MSGSRLLGAARQMARIANKEKIPLSIAAPPVIEKIPEAA
jgi:hypothetical protein